MNIESNKSVSLPSFNTEGTSKLRAHAISNQRILTELKPTVSLEPFEIEEDDGKYIPQDHDDIEDALEEVGFDPEDEYEYDYERPLEDVIEETGVSQDVTNYRDTKSA